MQLLNDFLDSYLCNYLDIDKNDCYYSNESVIICREEKFTKVETLKVEDWLDSRPEIENYEISENKITIWL